MIRSSKKDNSENRYRTEVEKQKYIKQKQKKNTNKKRYSSRRGN